MTMPAEGSVRRQVSGAKLLAALAVVAVIVAILTPEAPGIATGGRSTYTTAPAGTRMAYELAARLGWRVQRRLTMLDSAPRSVAVQVVLAPEGGLGGVEVHRLLENVRAGGGLVFSLDGNDEIADSLTLDTGKRAALLGGGGVLDPDCPPPQSIVARALFAIPPEVSDIVWQKRPLARETTLAVVRTGGRVAIPIAIGFQLGAGKVAVTSNSAVFSNEAVRNCPWRADLAVVSMFEYAMPVRDRSAPLVFDEFHHGFGIHGGTLKAAATYLAHTASGHFVIQALIAGLVLLMAKAPRPILPRDATTITRRSPLEHADALGRAYADVAATRTATSRLVGGLRRRVSRWIPLPATASDDAFLEQVARRVPDRAADVAAIRHALVEPLPPRELVAVGDALNRVEQAVRSSSSSTS